MKVRAWKPDMTDKESKHLAYWERNMLALRFADGWYNDDLADEEYRLDDGVVVSYVPRFAGWRRVLSLDGGKMTFHVPDDFDVGDLPMIEPNWDGHTTEEKWRRVLSLKNIKETT